MFGRNDALPVHGGTNRNNGVSIPVVNKWVVLSLSWILFSVYLFYYGFRHSRLYANISTLNCDKDSCVLRYQNSTGTSSFDFSRNDMKSTEVVRYDGKDVIDVSGMKKKAANKVGYSVQLKVNLAPEVGSRIKIPKLLLLHRADMGRSSSREASKKIVQYIDNDSETLVLSAGSGWTSLGVASTLIGFFSFVSSLLFGQFSDPEPKRQRKIR